MIPKWLLEQEGLTARQWRIRKRRELRVLIKAFEQFGFGCGFTPARDLALMAQMLEKWKQELGVKRWGR